MVSREMNPGTHTTSPVHQASARPSRVRAGITLALLYLVLVMPVVLSGRGGTSEADDEQGHHLPVIQTMAEQWPNVDLVHYESATSPGYHLFFAALHRYTGANELAMRLINALVSLAFVLFVWWMAARFINPWHAVALVLAFLFSTYVLGSAIWLTTDNASLFFALIAAGGASLLAPSAGRVLGWSIASTAAVFVRQIHLWCAAPVMLAFVLLTPMGRLIRPLVGADTNPSPHKGTWHVLWLVPIVLLPFGVLSWLVWMWGGLMPPIYADLHNAGPNPATLTVALALTGTFGLFFLPLLVQTRNAAQVKSIDWMLIALAALFTVLIPTSFDKDAGRWGGAIWELVHVLPSVAERSIVFPPLAALGAYVLIKAWRSCRAVGRQREATILLLSMFGWSLAQTMNTQAWQRYCEPIILVMLAWLVALVRSGEQTDSVKTPWTWALAGPIILAAIQFALACWKVYWPAFQSGVN